MQFSILFNLFITAFFPDVKPTCLLPFPWSICDGAYNCPDNSDEKGCACMAYWPFECNCYQSAAGCARYGCISQSKVCDGNRDCSDNSDEKGCLCRDVKHECDCYRSSDGCEWAGCIHQWLSCDGYSDCSDRSDENECVCLDDKFECDCYQSNAGCADYGCIGQSKVCDAYRDCSDNSDEKECYCLDDEYECDCYQSSSGCDWTGCIIQSKVCDGIRDCPDNSDENGCTCPDGIFECGCYQLEYGCAKFNGCLAQLTVCDNYPDCFDNSDEKGCLCRDDEYTCDCYQSSDGCKRGGCIIQLMLCDGRSDCSDHSDENGCVCPEDRFVCDCHQSDTGCANFSWCMAQSQVCDGYHDCIDSSDEKGCSCPTGKFSCNCYLFNTNCRGFNGCIDQSNVCNSERDCFDNSDEKGCLCPENEYECNCHQSTNGCEWSGCIRQSWLCDGLKNCPDHSDEHGCVCPDDKFECDCYQSDNGCGRLNGCTNQSQVCDCRSDCLYNSDEEVCHCPDDKFDCGCYQSEVGCACLDQRGVCDGRSDSCGDWSDEIDCLGTNLFCGNDLCVERSLVNNGEVDMASGDDEFICCSTQGHECGCKPGMGNCSSSEKCIPRFWVADTRKDCLNVSTQSDEPCTAYIAQCHECRIVINRCSTNVTKNFLLQSSMTVVTTCHINNPFFSHLNLSAKWICISSPCGKCLKDIFQCENGNLIENQFYCDSVPHCDDGSDEQQQNFGFQCSGKSRKSVCFLPQKNLYDSMSQCADGSDICFVNGEFRCFLCLDEKLIISAKQVCDGLLDCFDGSDELLCFNQTIAQALLFGDGELRCPPGHMHCNSSTVCVTMGKVLCNYSIACENDINQKFCRHQNTSRSFVPCYAMSAESDDIIAVLAAMCDKRPECHDMRDECNAQCEMRPSFCDDKCWTSNRLYGYLKNEESVQLIRVGNRVCDGYLNAVSEFGSSDCKRKVEENCTMRFPCKSGNMVSVDVREVCDGIFNCDNHTDEMSPDCLIKRFNCTAGDAISINKAFVCDGIKDCDHGEDEILELCTEKRFYCESGNPISIDKKFVQNGLKDCESGLDECESLFSNKFEMIANPALRSSFWIMGFLASIGNLATNVVTIRATFCKKKKNKKAPNDKNLVKLANSLFILNLTISDFIMGIYLLGVVGQSLRYSGFYCFIDKKWRSSNLCSVFGTLAMISSEASALIMASMSTFRLVTVYKPFLSRSMKIRWVVIAGIVCWLFSISLALLPWIPFDSGYFVSQGLFPNYIFGTDVVPRSKIINLANRVVSRNSTPIKSWFRAKQIISETFKYSKSDIEKEFGFYAQISVCMPHLFASTGDAAWEYSLFLITHNFSLFIFMVVVYVLMYRKVASLGISSTKKKEVNKGMQKRISRLLLTDCLCWIPVCIMGYVSIAGVALPANAYIVSAGLLLPINSAVNPLIYSKLVGEYVSRTKQAILRNFRMISPRAVRGIESSNVATNAFELREIRTNT